MHYHHKFISIISQWPNVHRWEMGFHHLLQSIQPLSPSARTRMNVWNGHEARASSSQIAGIEAGIRPRSVTYKRSMASRDSKAQKFKFNTTVESQTADVENHTCTCKNSYNQTDRSLCLARPDSGDSQHVENHTCTCKNQVIPACVFHDRSTRQCACVFRRPGSHDSRHVANHTCKCKTQLITTCVFHDRSNRK